MLKGFKDFMLRGNVIDLSVAVVIGAAFTAIVTSFSANIINPLIARVGGAQVGGGLGVQLGDAGNERTFINLGSLFTAVVNFVIIAAVVYFAIVVPVNLVKERRRRGVESGAAEPTDVQLLAEIRDLLKAQRG